ncbi:MAG: hypothetical protein WAU58_06400 [Terriglobales bacterium]
MRRNISRMWMLVAVAGLALPLAAQVRSRTSTTSATHITAAKTPYTAEYKITQVQTLAGGNTITRESTEVAAVDSQGRRMTSTTTTAAENGTPRTESSVFDPVAKTLTRWSSPGKRARVRQIGVGHGCSSTTEDEPRPSHSLTRAPHERPAVENLGTASIQGVEARGTRTTMTIPAGEVGNEAPLVRTSEVWSAVTVGLKGLLVREVVDDPRSGKWNRELTSINQNDPDPAVFQPPDGYEIVKVDASEAGCATEAAPAK